MFVKIGIVIVCLNILVDSGSWDSHNCGIHCTKYSYIKETVKRCFSNWLTISILSIVVFHFSIYMAILSSTSARVGIFLNVSLLFACLCVCVCVCVLIYEQ